MRKRAVVLLSGGLDSTTVLAMAKSKEFECYALSFSYGQKHNVELTAAERIAKIIGVKEHKIISLHSLGELGGSATTDKDIPIHDHKNTNEIPNTYVPARNTIFLSLALGWAEVLSASDIFYGATDIDYSGYPDCRPNYVKAFEVLANLATKAGIEGKHITIHAPLLGLTKAQTIKTGLALGIDYSLTLSCYRLNEQGLACGKCDSCAYRKKGFLEANISDPTLYIDCLV